MKQKFNVTGMTCSACSAPRESAAFAGGPSYFICRGELNPPGFKVSLRETLGTRRKARMGGAYETESAVSL